MKNTLLKLSAALGVVFMAAPASQAAVTITFSETGGDVVATVGGTASELPIINPVSSNGRQGLPNRLFSLGFFSSNQGLGTGGTAIPTTLNATPDESTIDLTGIGYQFDVMWVPENTPAGAYSPVGEFTWSGKDIATIFGGAAPTGSFTVYEFSNYNEVTAPENRIDFVFDPVPEPSSAALLGLGGLGLMLRRRRKA